MLPGKGFSLFLLHLSPTLQVTLVSDQHDHHVGVGVLASILQPGGQVIEGVPPGDVIHEESSSGSPVIRSCDGAKGFLPSRVPNLQLNLFPVDSDHAGSELDSNGQVMYGLETLVRKLQ
uniref:Putative secreted protein n=1 Tax=Ixodes ricinus TaxID=34613 RepID=A0A6B0UML4_IXORI